MRETERPGPRGGTPKRDRPRCGARTRAGEPCRAAPARDPRHGALANGRCRMHGGLSTGPRTLAGWKRVAHGRAEYWRAWRHRRALELGVDPEEFERAWREARDARDLAHVALVGRAPVEDEVFGRPKSSGATSFAGLPPLASPGASAALDFYRAKAHATGEVARAHRRLDRIRRFLHGEA